MIEWVIESFGSHHLRNDFSCGQAPLDDFIRAWVSQYEKRRLGKTFVAVPRGEARVLGYYTMGAGAVAFERMPADVARKLPTHPVPVILLARLAVDQSAQKQRLGEGLLLDALERTLNLSKVLGVHAVQVNAIDTAAAAFYLHYGFTPLLDNALDLYLPLATIERLWRSK